MDSQRFPSHDFGENAAAYHLKALPGLIEKNSHRISSGKLDDNLVVIFNSLAKDTAELACLQYFYQAAPTAEVLDLFGRSALATANMFRLLGHGGAASVTIAWDGNERVVPSLPHIDLHNSGKFPFGLTMALLSGRTDDMDVLCNIQREHYVHSQIVEHEFVPQYTYYLQLLFSNRDAAYSLKNKLQGQVSRVYSDRDPDSKYIRARCELFLSLVDQGAEQIEPLLRNLLSRHKALFDSERNNMRWNILGLLCTDALAAIGLARRRDCALECENPYVPGDLLAAALERNNLP